VELDEPFVSTKIRKKEIRNFPSPPHGGEGAVTAERRL